MLTVSFVWPRHVVVGSRIVNSRSRSIGSSRKANHSSSGVVEVTVAVATGQWL